MQSLLSTLVAYLTAPGTAILIVALVLALETWLSRPDPMGFLESLEQPSWALPKWAAMTVPFLFYALAIHGLTSVIRAGDIGAIALIVAVLVAHTVLNHLLFGQRRFDWASAYAVPLALFAAVTAYLVSRIHLLSGIEMAGIAAILTYDLAWVRALARLNPQHTGARGAQP